MTIGVGGVSKEQALAGLQDMTQGAQPIGLDEYRVRLAKAQAYMQANGIAALTASAKASGNQGDFLLWVVVMFTSYGVLWIARVCGC